MSARRREKRPGRSPGSASDWTKPAVPDSPYQAARPPEVQQHDAAPSSGEERGSTLDGIQIYPSGSLEASRDLGRQIGSQTQGGESLTGNVRESLQQGLGADLSRVRLHTDPEADRLSRAVDAAAFTSGSHIFFRSGSYDPGSPRGHYTLAHEAAHVLQQPDTGTRPTGEGIALSQPGDPLETTADSAARSIALPTLTRHDAPGAAAGSMRSSLGTAALPGSAAAPVPVFRLTWNPTIEANLGALVDTTSTRRVRRHGHNYTATRHQIEFRRPGQQGATPDRDSVEFQEGTYYQGRWREHSVSNDHDSRAGAQVADFAGSGIGEDDARSVLIASGHEGGYNTINTYDSAGVTAGFNQDTTGSENLQVVIGRLRRIDQAAYVSLFEDYGIWLEGRELRGLDPEPPHRTMSQAQTVRLVRTDPRYAALFIRAGQNPSFQQAQREHAVARFNATMHSHGGTGHHLPVAREQIFRSIRGRALLVDRAIQTPVQLNEIDAVVIAEQARLGVAWDQLHLHEADLLNAVLTHFQTRLAEEQAKGEDGHTGPYTHAVSRTQDIISIPDSRVPAGSFAGVGTQTGAANSGPGSAAGAALSGPGTSAGATLRDVSSTTGAALAGQPATPLPAPPPPTRTPPAPPAPTLAPLSTATPTPGAASTTALSAPVAVPVTQPAGQTATTSGAGWSGAAAGSYNAGEREVGGTRRIPLDGLQSGGPAQDGGSRGGRTPEAQASAEGGRAIVIIPLNLPAGVTSVEVLFHLHGFGLGYRSGGAQGQETPHDVSISHIEDQLASTGRPMIAILPQGDRHSFFGQGSQAAVQVEPYVREVFARLNSEHLWGGNAARQPGSIALSGHSGAGHPLQTMLSRHGGPTGSLPTEALFLFDAMNSPGQEAAVQGFLTRKLDEERAHLAEMAATLHGSGTPAVEVTDQQVRWIHEHGFRFRGITTWSGYYVTYYQALQGALDRWFGSAEAQRVIGTEGNPVHTALLLNYSIGAAHASHEGMMGAHNNFARALGSLPGGVAATQAPGTPQPAAEPATPHPAAHHAARRRHSPHPATPATSPAHVSTAPPQVSAPPTPAPTSAPPAPAHATEAPHHHAARPAHQRAHRAEAAVHLSEAEQRTADHITAAARPLVGTPNAANLWPLLQHQILYPASAAPRHDANDPLAGVYTALFSADTLGVLRARGANKGGIVRTVFDAIAPSMAPDPASATAAPAVGGETEIAQEEALISGRIRDGCSDSGWQGVRRGLLGAFGVLEVGPREAIARANRYYGSLVPARIMGHTGSLVHPTMQEALDRATAAVHSHQPPVDEDEVRRSMGGVGGFNIRANRNAPSVLSDHSFGWAVDFAADLNPNVGHDHGSMAPMQIVTGVNVDESSTGESVAHGHNYLAGDAQADIEREAERLRQASVDYVAAMHDETSFAGAVQRIVNHARSAEHLQPIDSATAQQVAQTARTRNAQAREISAQAFPEGGDTPPGRQQAINAVLVIGRAFRASFTAGGGRVAAQSSATAGSVAAHGFMSLHPVLVAALAGREAGNLVWLGSSGVHDFMHFELPHSQRPSFTGS